MTKRYHALRFIATVYKIIGAILGVLTILGVIAFCVVSLIGGTAYEAMAQEFGMDAGVGFAGSMLGAIVFGLFGILSGGGAALTLYGTGELIYLLLDLEQNTRNTNHLLQRNNF
ncbi:MAG: hypothetical protein JW862_16855 [Anaerolineales bacterium]|nr:hypothetical protein [Anaerolineales bacterium]